MVARRAHNPKVVGSNPAPATTLKSEPHLWGFLLCLLGY
jgi:ribosome maturation factor RimP